ncbi:MAG: energy transducer TonB [Bacteroidota bacterium]
MALRKAPEADLKQQYPIVVQIGMLLSLGLVLAAFITPYRAEAEFEIVEMEMERIEIEEIEQTQQIETPPPPPKPPSPVEVPDEELLEDEEIDLDMDLDLNDAPPPPPPPPPAADEPEPEPEEPEIFRIVEQQPVLLPNEAEGMAALQGCIRYPEMAKRAGIEGRVFVQFVVDERGNVVSPQVVRGIGGGTDDEALRCVRDLKFRPGMQRGRPVKVQFSLPVTFRLR